MIRKTVVLILASLMLFSSFPNSSEAASGVLREYYPPSDSDFYQKRIAFKYYNDWGTAKIRFTQYNYDDTGEEVKIGEKEFPVKENSDIWIDQTCKGHLVIQWLDSAGNVTDTMARGVTTSYLDDGDCSNIVNPSNFNEEKNQYADDTFGATKEAPGTPGKDGSGGDGETGLDNGSGSGDPGTGGTDSDGDGTPDSTDPYPKDPNHGGTEHDESTHEDVFHSPHWDEYMKKVDEAISKIPPAPNWDEVASKFRDTIAPKIKQDLEDLLGRSPAAPAAPKAPAPAELGGLDDRGISAPGGTEAPGLGGSTFTPDDIKSQAPVIQERTDESGGFEINDPMVGLPSQEEFMKNLPKPEEGQSSNPGEQDLQAPAAPKDDDNLAPSPSESDNAAPMPVEGDNEAPNPAEGDNVAPTPTEGSNSAPLPGSDGSTAPIPGDNTDTAPVPDPTNETAPLPGG